MNLQPKVKMCYRFVLFDLSCIFVSFLFQLYCIFKFNLQSITQFHNMRWK